MENFAPLLKCISMGKMQGTDHQEFICAKVVGSK